METLYDAPIIPADVRQLRQHEYVLTRAVLPELQRENALLERSELFQVLRILDDFRHNRLYLVNFRDLV